MLVLMKHCNRETVSYLICGVLTTLVGIAVFWLCDEAGLHVAASNTLSTIAAVTFAYLVNKIFVFRSRSWAPAVLAKEAAAFVAGRVGTFVAETLLLVALVDWAGLPGFWCKVFTSVLVVIGNYVISKKWVFKA